jgi:cell division protein FtsB
VAQLLSVRTLVLGVVVLSAFTLLFPTVRACLGQRAELDALAAHVTQAEQEEDDLRSELDRWHNPAYVAAQARERLSYVMPGETAYRVVDPEVVVEDPVVEGAPAEPTDGPTLPTDSEAAPWYTTVWESVSVAGESPVPADAR